MTEMKAAIPNDNLSFSKYSSHFCTLHEGIADCYVFNRVGMELASGAVVILRRRMIEYFPQTS